MGVAMTDEKSPHHMITNIENKTANMDTGRMGYQIIQGAMEEGATPSEAISILTAYYASIFIAASELNKDKDEETPSS